MKALGYMAAMILFVSTACERRPNEGTTQTTGGRMPGADNTKVNERDRGNTLTPLDQGNNQSDLDTTQRIRQAIMANDGLSNNAKNVKVITKDGVVVLRGPVKDQGERVTIENIARQQASAGRVDSQLEIAP